MTTRAGTIGTPQSERVRVAAEALPAKALAVVEFVREHLAGVDASPPKGKWKTDTGWSVWVDSRGSVPALVLSRSYRETVDEDRYKMDDALQVLLVDPPAMSGYHSEALVGDPDSSEEMNLPRKACRELVEQDPALLALVEAAFGGLDHLVLSGDR